MGLRSLLNTKPPKRGLVQTQGIPQGQVVATGQQPVQAPSAAIPAGQLNPQGFGNIEERTIGGRNIQSGFPFVTASRGLAREALGRGLTGESEQAQALRGGLGEAILGRLGGLQDNAATRRNLTQASLDRALNRNLAQARRQFAGTGLAGTSQGGRSVGELLAGAQQANVDAEIALQDQSLRELLGLTEAGGATQQQELLARQQQFAQQKALSDLLERQAETEIGRQSGLASAQPGGPSLLETLGLQLGGQALGAGVGGLTGGLGLGAAASILGSGNPLFSGGN